MVICYSSLRKHTQSKHWVLSKGIIQTFPSPQGQTQDWCRRPHLCFILESRGELFFFNVFLYIVLFCICVALFFFNFIYLFIIYFWLHWVFVAARGLSLVAASGGYSSLWCEGFSLQWLLLLWLTGSRAQAQ